MPAAALIAAPAPPAPPARRWGQWSVDGAALLSVALAALLALALVAGLIVRRRRRIITPWHVAGDDAGGKGIDMQSLAASAPAAPEPFSTSPGYNTDTLRAPALPQARPPQGSRIAAQGRPTPRAGGVIFAMWRRHLRARAPCRCCQRRGASCRGAFSRSAAACGAATAAAVRTPAAFETVEWK